MYFDCWDYIYQHQSVVTSTHISYKGSNHSTPGGPNGTVFLLQPQSTLWTEKSTRFTHPVWCFPAKITHNFFWTVGEILTSQTKFWRKCRVFSRWLIHRLYQFNLKTNTEADKFNSWQHLDFHTGCKQRVVSLKVTVLKDNRSGQLVVSWTNCPCLDEQ